ncbi:hypothetical protein SBY92_005015 [Candida maltosa Xu316]|uniref:2-dehydropantoate 2-reductase n=1 Tax=Candida maltosa (strain Xu316) TaxID=1245528 RepID=M3JZG2_CANMX|nr:hypothetical protein G210_1713 [Candida maltosa Xu316]
MSKPKVLIIGSGGVGAISALSLTTTNKSEVTLVVRSDYDLIDKQGFSINSCTYGELKNWKPHHIARSVKDAQTQYGPFDYILLTTKNIPDGPITCEEIIQPAIKTGNEVIILLQNGLGIENPMVEAFPGHIVLSGVSLIGSTYIDGHVRNPGRDHVFLGDFKPESERLPGSAEKIEEFISIYQTPDNKNTIVLDTNVQKRRWEKLIYNSVFNVISALVELDNCRTQMTVQNDELIRPAMYEVIAIAKSEGIECDESLVDKYIHIGDGLFYVPSMGIDAHKGQLIELETILGNPMRIAKKNNVSTPILSTLYPLLKLVQFRLKEKRGMFTIDKNDFQGNSDVYPKVFAEKYGKH